MTASFAHPHPEHRLSRRDQAESAGFDPGEDYNQPPPLHLVAPEGIDVLAVFAAQVDHVRGIVRCSHPHCRTSVTDDDMSRCPHDLPFCELCVWEDGCDDCGNGITDYKEGVPVTHKENEAVQFALQIQVNSGTRSAYWAFDSDFEVHDHVAPAWDDMDAAEDMGYGASDLRVVAITVLPEPEVES